MSKMIHYTLIHMTNICLMMYIISKCIWKNIEIFRKKLFFGEKVVDEFETELLMVFTCYNDFTFFSAEEQLLPHFYQSEMTF